MEALYRRRLAALLVLRASPWGPRDCEIPIPLVAGALTSIVSERWFTTKQ